MLFLMMLEWSDHWAREAAYVNAPELLDAVEADDFLEKFVPVLL